MSWSRRSTSRAELRRHPRELTRQQLTDHLGYEPHDPVGRGSGNSRNGRTKKKVQTDIGQVEIEVPRDRNGTFDPKVVPKHARRLGGFNDAILSLYAKGMTTGDIQAHLGDMYGQDVSRELVSKVTDAVIDELVEWQNRPLDAVYPVVLIDCIVVKIRDGAVQNRPVYVAMGINLDGERDVLGLWSVPPAARAPSTGWPCSPSSATAALSMCASCAATACAACPTRSPPPGRRPRSRPVWCTWSATACGTPPRRTGARSPTTCAPSRRARASPRHLAKARAGLARGDRESEAHKAIHRYRDAWREAVKRSPPGRPGRPR